VTNDATKSINMRERMACESERSIEDANAFSFGNFRVLQNYGPEYSRAVDA